MYQILTVDQTRLPSRDPDRADAPRQNLSQNQRCPSAIWRPSSHAKVNDHILRLVRLLLTVLLAFLNSLDTCYTIFIKEIDMQRKSDRGLSSELYTI